ncbi:MAG: site-2 protease family protein [Nitrosomonadales bacterium]|jgi:Zn-dependent protease|nr:site-2 protease family protein [Nitrosomonadales bacterium]MBT4571177.1 site-2 protease family protein [Nitrosomonadales bacterium]MBT6602819.1 site-2 protease family protein [Nitrosomonadales bacterium]MBT7120622.1 site-2 protease family protein [Nitrosomonadales bacterium]MBT7407035.1 site-2 protease family protein [Nitrosomonadales bacterium]
MDLTIIQKFAAYSLPIIFAITVHEAAHGYAAKYFGDMTAFHLKRISLNPLRHIDPLGTIILPAALFFLQAGFIFGWAKPVPVNFSNLRNPKKDMIWVALAGPGANLLMAIFWTIVYSNQLLFPSIGQSFVGVMAVAGIQINIVLMVLNLLPLPPLDGGRVAVGLLPYPWASKLAGLERYGFFILIFLLATGLLGAILSPLIRISQSIILTIFG